MKSRLPTALRVVHWAIIVNFALQILYGFQQVFFVVVPEGVVGPLGDAAKDLPFEMMVTRRLYALETWVAIAGLSIYVGLTEVLPRRLQRGSGEDVPAPASPSPPPAESA